MKKTRPGAFGPETEWRPGIWVSDPPDLTPRTLNERLRRDLMANVAHKAPARRLRAHRLSELAVTLLVLALGAGMLVVVVSAYL